MVHASRIGQFETFDLSEKHFPASDLAVAAGDEAEGYACKRVKALQPLEADLADERHKVVNLEAKVARLREDISFWTRAAFQSYSFGALRAWWFTAKAARLRSRRAVDDRFKEVVSRRFLARS